MSGEDYNMRISEEVERVPLVISDEFNNGMEQGLPSAEIGQSSSSSNSVVGRGRQPFLRNCSDTVNEHIGKIGYLGSMAIAVNSLTGPAMLNIPDTYQRAGVIPTTVTVILLSILSSFCCLHMANTISKVPHNSNYQKEIEYSETFEKFWGHKAFVFTQILFFACVVCLNVSSIVDTAQVVDTIAGHWLPNGTGAILFHELDGDFRTDWVRWDYTSCTEETLAGGDCIPFGENEDAIVFSLGYFLVLLIFVPMALMDLKENAFLQVIGFIVLLVTSLQFIVLFAKAGIHTEHLSLWGDSWDTLFGVILFNFALVIAVPAWLYEKEPHVDVPTVIHTSTAMSSLLYISIGILGAMSMPHVSQNMLESMMSGVFGMQMEVSASIFAFFIIGLGCPLFSVLCRLNLTGSGLVSHRTGNILAVYLPFSLSWLFYQGEALTKLLSWGGIMFTSLVAFILPLLVSIYSLHVSDVEGAIAVYGESQQGPTKLSKETQKILLYILLTISMVSITAAITGNFV